MSAPIRPDTIPDKNLEHTSAEAAADGGGTATTAVSDAAATSTSPGLIAEILRTRVCVPGSVFTVEGVDLKIVVAAAAPLHRRRRRRRRRIVRLLLGDGDGLCIQALLHPDAHRLVDDGDGDGPIREGCRVRLDAFGLRVLLASEAGPPVVFLVVEEISAVVGHDEEEAAAAPLRAEAEPSPGVSSRPETAAEAEQQRGISRPEMAVEDRSLVVGRETSCDSVCDGRQAGPEVTVAPAVDGANEAAAFEPAPLRGGGHQPSTADGRLWQPLKIQPDEAGGGGDGGSGGAGRAGPGSSATPATTAPLPWTADDLTRPLKLTALRSIPFLPYKQNWAVNVLAVVSEVSALEPSHLPPYSQRTARLADPSTGKRVLLTVFLDPEAFTPQVGSVVLLLGVKNHRFDGGSLKKYASDRPRDGRAWWLQDPRHLGWCDVEELRSWWAVRHQSQGVAGGLSNGS